MTNTAVQIQLVNKAPQQLPIWLPRSWRTAASGQLVQLHIPRPVRRRCTKAKKMTPSELSVKFRRMPAAEANPGAYRIEFAKHAPKVMDTWAQPWVREVCFCGVDQASKTNTMLSCIFWVRDQAPGNIFYQMPDETSSDNIMRRKLIPMLKESERVSKHLSARADDTALGLVTFSDGMAIQPSYSGSTTSTATFAARYTFSDEVDKMKMVGKEADPITRIKKRTRTKQRIAKNFFCSTPAGKYIYKMTMACVQVWTGAARCPDCDELIVMDVDHVSIPEGATVESIKSDPTCIEYSCACGSCWDEEKRGQAYTGEWVCIKGADIARPVDVGFLLPAFPLPDVPLVDIAIAILKAKQGDVSAQRDLAHGIKAIDYELPKAVASHEAVLALCDDRPRDLVPTGTAALALQVDTQQEGFYYELAAIAYGDAGTSHLISKGYLLNFADLLTLSGRTWTDVDKKEYRIQSALIDSGGTRKAGMPPKHSRTKEVYEFCKANPMFIPVKGTGRKDTPVKYTTLDRWPGTNKPIPGGLILVVMDVHYFKDELARRLAISIDDPGAFVLYSGYTQGQLEQQKNSGILPANELEDYAKHLCSEYRDELLVWHHDKNAGRNDYADCATYRMFHIELLKMQGRLVKPKEAAPEPHKQTSNAASTGQTVSRLPTWFNRR